MSKTFLIFQNKNLLFPFKKRTKLLFPFKNVKITFSFFKKGQNYSFLLKMLELLFPFKKQSKLLFPFIFSLYDQIMIQTGDVIQISSGGPEKVGKVA